jgi:hypothetical protein
VACLAALGAVLAGCAGGSASVETGLDSPVASPSLATGSAPLSGTLDEAVAEFWRLVDEGDVAALVAASAPGQAGALPGGGRLDIEGARLVSIDSSREIEPGTWQVAARVFIDPSDGASPWGDPGEHLLFLYLDGSSGGGWLLCSWGTGP